MINENTQPRSRLPIEEKLAAKENRIELLKRLSELGPLDRDILVMKLIQGNSDEEIAVNMKLVKCTVEERIYCAFKKWDSI